MRVWDLSPRILCRNHLLGEHREVHAIWSILTRGRLGYSRHPETMRWRGKLRALRRRHEELVNEMERRGYHHRTPLPARLATGQGRQRELLQTLSEQRQILRDKHCGCQV